MADAYQERVSRWVAAHGGTWPPLANLARLSEEVGELARVLNARFGPKTPKPGEQPGDLGEEIGDIAFVLAVLAGQLHVDLAAAAEQALAKAARRDSERF